MKTPIMISEAQSDREKRELFIESYMNFVAASASKVTGRRVCRDDDAFSLAIIAFDEAISRYSEDKGNFFTFASGVIKSRLIDDYRKTSNREKAETSMYFIGADGEPEEYEIVGEYDVKSDVTIELEILKTDLEFYGITMFDLAKCSPKSFKTKNAVALVLEYIRKNDFIIKSITNKKELPVKCLCDEIGVKRKIIERHRKYIIAATLILTGDFPIISEYVKGLTGVMK